MQPKQHSLEDITVIIRSAGERTVGLCKNALETMFPSSQLSTIEERPFSKALKRGLEIGIESKRPWILFVDADVVIDRSGLSELVAKRQEVASNAFEIQGLIRDRFFPVDRPSGAHLYRTTLAYKGLQSLKEGGQSLRPESSMLKAMARKGMPWYQSSICVGVHDFEQYHRDIYRKCFLHAHKSMTYLPYVAAHWMKRSAAESDFMVAALAALEGASYTGVVAVDKDFLRSQSQAALSKLGIAEKDGLRTNDTLDVSAAIRKPVPNELLGLQSIMAPSIYLDAYAPTIQKSSKVRSLRYYSSGAARRIGRFLVELGERSEK